MRFLGIIPARAGSKRLPGKNMLELCGRPLIGWTIEASRSVLDRLVVSTDCERTALYARSCGVEVIGRPSELATDEAKTIDAVRHVLDVKRLDGYRPDAIVLLQPTSPLRIAKDISGAIAAYLETDCPVVSVSASKPNGAVYVAQTLSVVWGDSWYGPLTIEYPMPVERSIDIDTIEDFKAAEMILSDRKQPLRMPGPYG